MGWPGTPRDGPGHIWEALGVGCISTVVSGKFSIGHSKTALARRLVLIIPSIIYTMTEQARDHTPDEGISTPIKLRIKTLTGEEHTITGVAQNVRAALVSGCSTDTCWSNAI